MKSYALLITLFFSCIGTSSAGEIFDMEAIRDPSTLEIEVLQDWHRVEGRIATRQKLVTINVGELWAGQDYRVPVRMGSCLRTGRQRAFISPAEIHQPGWLRIQGQTRWRPNSSRVESGWS